MEAQLQRHPHGHHHHEQDPHNTGLHSGGGEGEKKSVLKKVKDKAKKMKDTIKKHGHDHDQEDRHRRGGDIYQQGFQEEDDDEEVDSDPEIHGAPIYESSTIKTSTITNLEKPTDRREDRYKHNARDAGTTQPFVPGHRLMEAPSTTLPNVEQPKIHRDPRVGLEEDSHAPTNSPPNVLPSNYQSKVTDPAGPGGKEADVAPLANIGDHGAPGRHVQFAPEPTPMQEEFNQESKPENKESNSKVHDSGDTEGMSMNTIAGKVGETLVPVYDKVAGTGSAVLSKVYGMVGGENEGGDQDQGLSMKEYLSEKFRPGDEDKALSEVITSALQKNGTGEKKLGKVTMSKEVAAHLGGDEDSKREGEDAVAAGRESSGQGVLERFTDAVGLWLGKSEGIQTAKDSVGQSHVSDAASSGSGGVGGGKGMEVGRSGVTD